MKKSSKQKSTRSNKKYKKIILALDPSLRAFGYSIIGVNGWGNYLLAGGCIKTESKKSANGVSESLHLIGTALSDIITQWKVTEIVFEDPEGARSSSAARSLFCCKGLILGICVQTKLPFTGIVPKEVKKRVHGSVVKDKDLILSDVLKVFPNLYLVTGTKTKSVVHAVSDAAAVFIAVYP